MDWIVWRSFFLRSRRREAGSGDKTRGIKEEERVTLLYLLEEDFVFVCALMISTHLKVAQVFNR
jgi:hypothetical protein